MIRTLLFVIIKGVAEVNETEDSSTSIVESVIWTFREEVLELPVTVIDCCSDPDPSPLHVTTFDATVTSADEIEHDIEMN
jgi:hypothetical protein